MTAVGVHHAGRIVSDLDASLRFYRDLMGFRVDDDEVLEGEDISRFVQVERARLRAVMLSLDGSPPFIELTQFLHPLARAANGENAVTTVGDGHISIMVSDIHRAFERLSGAGVPFNSPPIPVTKGTFAGQWVAACLDPDGLMVELWCDRGRDDEQALREDG